MQEASKQIYELAATFQNQEWKREINYKDYKLTADFSDSVRGEKVELIKLHNDNIEYLKIETINRRPYKHGDFRNSQPTLVEFKISTSEIKPISIGTLNASLVHPREVFLPAITHSAASLILAHNHPSGDPQPSQDDITLTNHLINASELLDIAILDHLIVTSSSHLSLKETGHL